MTLKIRLRKQGRKNRPFYRLVLADIRSPRDGKYQEMLGWYNPFGEEQEQNAVVHADRVAHWLGEGAQMSEKAEALIKRSAPSVYKQYQEKLHARRVKQAAKRRKRKKQNAA